MSLLFCMPFCISQLCSNHKSQGKDFCIFTALYDKTIINLPFLPLLGTTEHWCLLRVFKQFSEEEKKEDGLFWWWWLSYNYSKVGIYFIKDSAGIYQFINFLTYSAEIPITLRLKFRLILLMLNQLFLTVQPVVAVGWKHAANLLYINCIRL